MFDLFRSRDKAVRYFLGAILVIIAFSMVITLVPGFGSQSSSADTPILASVAGEKITTTDVRNQINQMMKNRSLPPQMLAMYVPQMVDSMIADRALAYEAKRMGIEVSDDETANAIRSILAPLFPNGQLDKTVYERYLQDQGMSIPEFEANVRKQMLLTRLRNIPLEGVVVTPQEIADEYHRRNDKVKIDYVVFDPANYKSQVKVTDQDALNYFNANRRAYMTPEKRTIDVLVGDEAKIGATLTLPDAQLRAAYNQNLNNFRVPDRVKVRHILVKADEKASKDEKAKAKAKAEDLLKQIKAGADFAKLAKENSDDPGSRDNGGDLGWIVKGQMVKPFEDSAFSLGKGQLSGIVETQFGYHILRVDDKEIGHLKPFEEVKDQIATELKKQLVVDKLQQSMDQARAELVKNPGNGQQIANKYNLTYVHAADIAVGQPLPEIGANQQLDTALAGQKVNDPSQVFQLDENRLAVAVITKDTPPQPGEYAQFADTVKSTLADSKANELAQQKFAQSFAKLMTPGTDFRAEAKSLGLDVKTSDFFSREGNVEGIGPAAQVADAFVRPVGSVFGPVNIAPKIYICKVDEKQSADLSGLPNVRDDIQLALKRRKAAERQQLFDDGIVNRLVKDGKIKKYDDNIKRFEQSLRS